ncbi:MULTISPECIES: GerMN domain-containing protein [Streptomyces]|uniref:GerMN domain-containing protein n=1 Tax=Streptomyces TaxID=1883 RepID=UPI000B9E5069|nr:GerMN domain-containing protein [Streptomyces kasugaensis]
MSARNAPTAARAGRLALGGLLAGALAGCGIAPTDVIDAGVPASGVKAPGQPVSDVQLFFYGQSGLRSATRPTKTPAGPQSALDLLLAGPDHAERMRGLSSVLPKFSGPLTADTTEGRVQITLPSMRALNSAAMNQLVCTVANAQVPGHKPPGQVLVTLMDAQTRVGPMICGGNNAFPVIEPSPTGSPTPMP